LNIDTRSYLGRQNQPICEVGTLIGKAWPTFPSGSYQLVCVNRSKAVRLKAQAILQRQIQDRFLFPHLLQASFIGFIPWIDGRTL